MSTSLKRKVAKRKSARGTGRRFRLIVRSNADTEIFVIDGSLCVRHCAVGYLSKSLDSGLYKVRVVRGGGNREQLVDLDRRRDLSLYCKTFPAIAPIGPMLGTAVPQVERLARSAIVRHRKWPAEGILLLAHGEKRPRAENERLLHGIALRRWDDPTQQFTPAAARPRAAINGEDWEAQWWPAEPGCYVLGYPDGTHQAEQALLVAKASEQGKKWQTRVFLRETSSRTGHRVSSSIQMARYDSNVVYYDHYETIETARNALESERPIVSEWLINNLLHGKFDNPMMGLVGLHLFLSALESARAGKRSNISPKRLRDAERVIDVVLGNLEKLFGGRPSDLIALQVRAGRLKGAHVVKVTEPPMFWKSWDVLRQNTDEGEPVVIDRDFWNRISLSSPAGPYFAWQARADATMIPARYALPFELLDSRVPEISAESTAVAPVLLSARELAKTLGIPLSALAGPHSERVTAGADGAATVARRASTRTLDPKVLAQMPLSKMRLMSPEQAMDLYKTNAKLALDIINAAIEHTTSLRRLQFAGEEESLAMGRKAAKAVAEASSPYEMMAASQSASQDAVEHAMHYWGQMFDLISEMQRRLWVMMEEQIEGVPGVKEAKAAMTMMPDLRQAQNVIKAMQGVVGAGGSAFESMQKVMGDVTKIMPGTKR